MAINFPTSLDSLTNPTSTDLMENATAALDHATQHANINDAVEALEAKVGIDGSAVTTSHDYKLSGVTGSDKAVSKTGTETLTNKTLTSPVINVTSDATGDMYYRSAGGAFTRLAIGSSTNILAVSASGIPEWVVNPDTSDSTATTTGVVELATTAEINAGTASGGDGPLVVTPDGLAASNYVTSAVTDALVTDVQSFTASGTWTKPSGAKRVLVQAWGAGGGGGGTNGNAGGNAGSAGGGGGGYVEAWIVPSALSSTETVTIGAGGAGGAAGDNPGSDGGNSTFGSLVTAYGGGGGNGLSLIHI